MKVTLKSLRNRFKSHWLDLVRSVPVYHELDYSKSKLLLCDNIRLGSCAKEPDTITWIESFHKDDIAFDIGANVGPYSLIMSLYAKEVYAFEPAITNFNLLCRNLILNSQKETISNNIMPLNLALSDKTGPQMFNYINTAPGKSGHQVESKIDGFGTKFEPQFSHQLLCCALDDLVNVFGIPLPHHIKIDVDGIELKILHGASGVLDHPKVKTILVEMNEVSYPEREEMESFLSKKGFRLGNKFKLIPDLEFYNYLFIR